MGMLQILKPKQVAVVSVDAEAIQVMKDTIFKGFTDPEVRFSIEVVKKTGLDPLTRQIHFIKRKDRKTGKETISIQTGIDGFRLQAQRTNAYAGSDEPVFEFNDRNELVKATVTVYKIVQGIRCPFTASATWDEFCPGPPNDFMWKQKPRTMLGKCAEAQALRKAFPAELGNMYVQEEMASADAPPVVSTVAEKATQILDAEESQQTSAQSLEEAEAEVVEVEQPSLGDFVCNIGRTHNGKKLSEFGPNNLAKYLDWLKTEFKGQKTDDVLFFMEMASKYLEEK